MVLYFICFQFFIWHTFLGFSYSHFVQVSCPIFVRLYNMALYVFSCFHMAIGLKTFPMANFVQGILYGPLFV